MLDLSLVSTTLCLINGQSEIRADIIALFDDENETVTIFRKAKTQWSPLTLIRLKKWDAITKNETESFEDYEDLKSFVTENILEKIVTGGGSGETNKYVTLSNQIGTMLTHPDFANKTPILIVVDSVPLLGGFSKPSLPSTTINITDGTTMNNSKVLVLLQ